MANKRKFTSPGNKEMGMKQEKESSMKMHKPNIFGLTKDQESEEKKEHMLINNPNKEDDKKKQPQGKEKVELVFADGSRMSASAYNRLSEKQKQQHVDKIADKIHGKEQDQKYTPEISKAAKKAIEPAKQNVKDPGSVSKDRKSPSSTPKTQTTSKDGPGRS